MNDIWTNFKYSADERRASRRFRYHVFNKRNKRARIYRLPCYFCPVDEALQQPSEAHHVCPKRSAFIVVWCCHRHHRQIDHGALVVPAAAICDYRSLVKVQRVRWHEVQVKKLSEAPF